MGIKNTSIRLTKKELKRINRLSTLVSLGVVSLIAVITVFLIIINSERNTLPYPINQSRENAKITLQASQKHNASLCDKIKGGINAGEGGGGYSIGRGIADSFGYPEMNEQQAKQNCRSDSNITPSINDGGQFAQ
jgi:hypothetical protein